MPDVIHPRRRAHSTQVIGFRVAGILASMTAQPDRMRRPFEMEDAIARISRALARQYSDEGGPDERAFD